MAASFYGKIETNAVTLLCCHLLSTVSMDSLYSTLKLVMKLFDMNQRKAETIKVNTNKIKLLI